MQLGWKRFTLRLPALAFARIKDWFRLRQRAAEDRSFDKTYEVETGDWVRPGLLDVPDEVMPHITGYEPAPLEGLNRALGALDIDPEAFLFIDVGAGKGRSMIVAAEAGFNHVTGVEISQHLTKVARENIASFTRRSRRKITWDVVTCDARDYQFPHRNMAVFMYNPFNAGILQAVMDNLERSLEHHRHTVLIVYYNPACRNVIDHSPAFTLTTEGEKYLIYQRRLPGELATRVGGASLAASAG